MLKLIQYQKEGILRLCEESLIGKSLYERYGLLHLCEPVCITDFSGVVENAAHSLSVLTSRETPVLLEQGAALAEEFRDDLLNKHRIAGDESRITDNPAPVIVDHSPFAAAVEVKADEQFYGLGEAKRDGISLRGGAYQNWVVYQQNEIAIPFLFSNQGWGMLINCPFRNFVDCCRKNENYILSAGESGEIDLFFFLGHNVREVMDLYTSVVGRPLVLPKYAYGLTYIAPIYNDGHEVLADARELRQEGIPCDHISLEPGWMKKIYDFSTAKEWDIQRFFMPPWFKDRSDPRTFPSALRRYGFHLSLWFCIDYDFTAEDERRLARRQHRPIPTLEPAEPYFEHMGRLADAGIDGYKIDPCSLVDTRHLDQRCANGYTDMQMHNLQNTMMVRQIYEGFVEREHFRPMLHYCGGYTGVQAFSAHTTGDNGGREGALIWLLNLANSGCMNSTCDMDIHTPQSVHFAMLAPWAHLNNWSSSVTPWWAGETQHQMFARYARLRYYLLPYIYSCALEGFETGFPMIRPMPLQYPSDVRFQPFCYQYMFGDQLLICVYSEHVIFPEGTWIDYFTGETYTQGEADVPVGKDRGGHIFVRKGAILPCWSFRNYVTEKSDEEILLHIWPGDTDESFLFREDDGITTDYQKGAISHTWIETSQNDAGLFIRIGERKGDYSGKGNRVWKVFVHNCSLHSEQIHLLCAEGDRAFLQSECENGWDSSSSKQ